MKSRLPFLILIVGALVSLTPVVGLALYPFPSADDYCLAVEVRRGFWQMQLYTYLNWTGRYTATLVQAALSQWDLATIYRWFSLATVAATLLAVRALIGALSPKEATHLGLKAAATTATVVFIGRLPSPTEAFYWMTSAITYQWAIIVYLIWLALLVSSMSKQRMTPARRIAIAVLTALLPGFNEVLAPVVLLTVAGAAVFDRARTGTSNRFLVSLIGLGAVLTLVSLIAPGNAARSSSYPDIPSRHDLGFALVETARQTVRFLATFGAYPLLWVAACAAWWWGPRLLPGRWVPRGALGLGAVVAGVPAAVVYITLFPLYWEYGAVNYTGEGRTYNITYFLFCAAIVWVVGLVLDQFSLRWTWLRTPSPRRRAVFDVVLACALAALMVGAPGTVRAFRALPQGAEYLEAQRAREAMLRASHNRGKAIVVNAMHIRPRGLFWGGIQPDEGHWINACIASYYGLASVRTPTPPASSLP
jgi:hypothetical protein